jgi:hypothetical protein
MAQSVFDATLDVNNQIKVNTFDWSHSNNLTTQIGRITPIFCELVPNKGSIRINPRFGLQLMPMVFPVQTPMRARIAFFKYPLRALWKGYRDFVGNFRQGLEEPYIDFNSASALKAMASTGSLGDYLGLPTTLFGKYGTVGKVSSAGVLYSVKGNQFGGSPEFTYLRGIPLNSIQSYTLFHSLSPAPSRTASGRIDFSYPSAASASVDNTIGVLPCIEAPKFSGVDAINANSVFELRLPWKTIASKPTNFELSCFNASSVWCCAYATGSTAIELNLISASYIETEEEDNAHNKFISLKFSFPESMYGDATKWSFRVYLNMFASIGRRVSGNDTAWSVTMTPLGAAFTGLTDGVYKDGFRVRVTSFDLDGTSLYYLTSNKPVDLTTSSSPYYNSKSDNKDNQIKVSAYAFRAYEGIYNAYYRDNRNNPYYINGEVQYNQWIPSYEGGADSNIYELHYANWEKDFLTTAVQSPQQGTAPLVGITTYTETVSDESTGVTSEVSRVALVDEEGRRYQVAFDSDKDGLQGVKYVELDNDVKLRQPRNLIDVATSGISINDLRNVNAYQKFLELNMRKGYSYRDIIEGRFDVKVRYDELLMPEFFGGFSRDIDMHSITQTVDQQTGDDNSYKNALGSQAGVAGVRGDSNNSIECFCDEESIVMGVLIVTPMPVYTQLLPKHFTYRGLLDHYQPEFNHIGFQPILYKEVCPIQAYNDDSKSLGETFGYNRPWYEYVQKYDVAHGLFRTDLSNFLMHRVFNEKPQLAQSFLLIDPDQVTDVFSVTETTDKVYGQIYFDCTAKLPISRVAIPRLD